MTMAAPPPDYPEILLDLAACVALALERAGIGKDKAADIAFEAAEHVRRCWHGMPVYIPGAAHLDLAPKYQKIYERWVAGEPVESLAREYSYSVQWIRVVVRSARLDKSHKVECKALFDEPL
jgi:Mor family transcriptional regulator